MAYFRIIFKEDNKLWRKYFTFAYRFVIGDNEDVKFPENYTLQSSDVLKIQAINHQGDVVKDISFFKKEKISPFQRTKSHILVREDIFQEELFKDLKGITFLTVVPDGNFPYKYKMLSFTNVLDCVDWQHSIRKQFDFFSKLVLDTSKIPEGLNGFYLSNWNQFGYYTCIVDEKLKEALLQLAELPKFLDFAEL